MRVFLKHITRSLRAHPLQPVLIIITVSLCVCLCLCAIGLQGVFFQRSESVENQKTALGDIIISLGSDSEERVLFADDAQRILGDSASVFGDYSLTAFMSDAGNSVVRVRAAELLAADAYFLFDFAEYGSFTNENLASSVIISEAFARENQLSLGDTLTLEMLGQTASYTVQAIAEEDAYFKDCDVLCSISSAVRLLSERSPIIASMGDEFSPANRLMIRVSPDCDTQKIFEALSNSSCFQDDYIEISGSKTLKDLNVRSKNLVLGVITLILTLLCGMVVVSAHGFLTMQREVEYALFELSGASARQVAYLMLTEVFVYSLAGGIIGGGLSPFAFEFAASLFSWYKGGVQIRFTDFLAGFLVAFVLMLCCTLISLYRKSRKQLYELVSTGGYTDTIERPKLRLPLVLAILLVLTIVASLIMPIEYLYIPAAIMIVLSTLLIYTLFPAVFFLISSIFEKISSNKNPIFLLSQKNVKNGKAQKNIGRLTVVLMTLLVTISLCGTGIRYQSDLYNNIIKGDIIAVGIPSELKAELSDDESVNGFTDISYYSGAELDGRYSVMLIGINGNPYECMANEVLPSAVPKEGQVAVSSGLARLCGVDIGDRVSLSLGGNDYELEIAEITDAKTNLVYANTSSLEDQADASIISLKDPSCYSEVVSRLESEGVVVVDKNIFDFSGIDTLGGFLSLIEAAFFSALVVCCIGVFNILVQQAKMRKNERQLLSLSGMAKKQILVMNVLEIVTVFVISAVFAVGFGYAMYLMINLGANSFGIEFL